MAKLNYSWLRERLTWRNAIAALFALGGLAWKWLGIASRIKFILAIVGGLGGKWAVLAQIIGSTYFGVGITAVGVGYAILGEAPVRPVVGRVGSAILLMFGCAAVLGILAIMTLGYVEFQIQKLASQRETAYAVWQLTPDEQDRFAASIKSLSPTSRLEIGFLSTSSQAGMLAASIAEAAAKDGFHVRPTSDYSLSLSLVGAYIAIDESHQKDRVVPMCASILIAALRSVGIKPGTATKKNVGAYGCSIVIGIKPPDGR